MRSTVSKVVEFGRKVVTSTLGWFERHWGRLIILALVTASIIVPFAIPPQDWLPAPGDARTLLGSLLAAQGTILAMSMAVAIFVMTSVSSRRDADVRIYNEYVRRTWIRNALRLSVFAIALTAGALLVDWYFGSSESTPQIQECFRNLNLIAVMTFFLSLGIPIVLFERAVLISNPTQWSTLRNGVWQTSAKSAAQSYVARRKRADNARQAGELDFSTLIPDPGEGAASEAVQALRGDAQRAMQESRISEFNGAFRAIQVLIETTMDELEREGVAWSKPGVQPEWPLLWNLGADLYPLRREVIERGSIEYLQGISTFDYWLLSKGVDERCGEVLSAGLDGYRWNYHIAVRSGASEARTYVRGGAWKHLYSTFSDIAPKEAFPYAVEMIRHQMRLLEDAMRGQLPEDYEWLHNQIKNYLRQLIQRWDMQAQDISHALELANALDQVHRVAIMGLTGRAISLSQYGEIDDPAPYLNVARDEFTSVRNLAEDLARALEYDGLWNQEWSEWSTEGATDGVAHWTNPQQYPLKFFTVRFIELCNEEIPAINLGGHAGQVLKWFEANADSLLSYVSDAPNATKQDRREWALAALHDTVRLDDTEEDGRIIASELSEERVASFKSGLRATASELNKVERIFEVSGALLRIPLKSDTDPNARSIRELIPKAFLATPHPESSTHYAEFSGWPWAMAFADDAMRLFCQAIDKSPTSLTSLGNSDELFATIDRAVKEIQPSNEVVAILAGDWSEIVTTLRRQQDQNYIPTSRISGSAAYELGRYSRHSIVWGPNNGERRLYVVEIAAWGNFVQVIYDDNQALDIEISEIDADKASEILKRQPNIFADYPDEQSRLRKLQTRLDLRVCASVEFKVKDPFRARRISHCELDDYLDGK